MASINCPVCGACITADNIYGRFARCPDCHHEFVYQGGDLSELSERFLERGMSWNSLFEKIFDSKQPGLIKNMLSELVYSEAYEEYIPFVDVIDEDGKEIWLNVSSNNYFHGIDFEEFKLTNQKINSIPTKNIPIDGLPIMDAEMDVYDKFQDKYRFVGNVIYYIPVKIVRFKYKMSEYSCISYGNDILTVGVSIEHMISDLSNSNIEKFIVALQWLTIIVTIAAAWFVTCHTYYSDYGFLESIFSSTGFNLLLKFLGISFLALCGAALLGNLISIFTDNHKEKVNRSIAEQNLELAVEKFKVFDK